MDIAKQFVQLAKIGVEEEWSVQELAKKIEKLFESVYGTADVQKDTKVIRTKMSRFGETIYNNVSEALGKSKETDIIVMAGGLYKIFNSRKECNEYLLNVWDIRPSSCKDDGSAPIAPWIEHFEVMPAEKIQHFIVVCTDTEKEELDQIKTELIRHFKQLKKDSITCIPLSENEVGVVLESMHGTLGESHFQLSQFIKGISDKELRDKVSCMEAKRDEVTEKSFIYMPIIREILKDDYTREALSGPSKIVYINLTNNNISNVSGSFNTTNTSGTKSEKSKLKKWIRKHPPDKETVTKYHAKITKAKFDITMNKLNRLMIRMGYEKKRYKTGLRWIISDSDSDSSDSE